MKTGRPQNEDVSDRFAPVDVPKMKTSLLTMGMGQTYSPSKQSNFARGRLRSDEVRVTTLGPSWGAGVVGISRPETFLA